MKELRDYLKLIKRYLGLFVILTILALGAVFVYQFTQKNSYQGSATLYVNRHPEPRTDKYYTYEGYYASLVSKDYTDVAVALLGSADFIRSAQNRSGLDSQVKRAVSVRKLGPQLINVIVTDSSTENIRKLIKELINMTNERSKTNENQGADLTLINSDKNSDFNIVPKGFNLPIFLAIGVFGALLASIAIAAIREYLRA